MDSIKNITFPRLAKEHVVPVIVGTISASLVLYSSYHIVFSRNNGKKAQNIKEIPMPGSRYPYVGHLMSLGELPARTITKWHEELGPIIKLQMGHQVWISVNCPALAHKIFATYGTETSYRPYTVFTQDYHSMNGKGIAFAQPESSWKNGRTAAAYILASKQVLNYMDTIHKESRFLVDSLITATEKEGSVDPLKYLELNSLNVICAAVFGQRFDSIYDPEYEKTTYLVKAGIKFCGYEDDLGNFLPIISIFDRFFGKQAKMRQYISERNAVFHKLIEQAKLKEGNNLVKLLEENNIVLQDVYSITAEIDISLVIVELTTAATDSTATANNWALAILCHYPEVQEKISAEIDAFIRTHDRIPNFEDRDSLPYSISVMKECMRFRPLTPFGSAHTVQKDIEIDGYIIPKGCILLANFEGIHKNPERFSEPDQFKPERYMSNLKTMQSAINGKFEDRDHFIFGFGRRACPGAYLAEVEIFFSFVEIFARCSVKPANEFQMPDIEGAVNAGIVTAPLPFKIKLLKREGALLQ